MRKTNFLALLIIIFCLIFISIILAIYLTYKNKAKESNNININEDIISNNEKKLFEQDNTISQMDYDKTQLEDINLDLRIEVMVTDETIEYIIDNEDAIKTKIKEYILLNNINDTTMAVYETYQKKSDSNMIAVLFMLDNKNNTELIVVMDKKDNTIYVKEK